MLRGLLVALLLTEGVAWADDPLAQARRSVAASDYASARTQLAAALEAGNRGPDELAELYRLSGTVAAALGDSAAATDAFIHLLALSPKAVLPGGTSPKIQRPFDAAGRYIAAHGALEIKLETRSSPAALTLVAVNDPLDMVARARIVFRIAGGAEQTKDVAASERTEVALPAARRIDARVAALDVHGNRLIEIGTKDVPIVIVGEAPVVAAAPPPVAAPAEPAPSGPRPLWLRWQPYAIATAVFGGATAYFGWAARSASHDLDRIYADSTHHTSAEAERVLDRGRRDALLTNLGLGITGACAVTSAVLWYTARGRTEPTETTEPQVAAVPVTGGGAIVFGGNF
jgi:hypothetical protein